MTKQNIYNNPSTTSPQSTMPPKKTTTSAPVAPSAIESIPVFKQVWDGYWSTTNHQTLLIDAFLGFLVAVGGIQTLYFLICGRNVRSYSQGQTTQNCRLTNIAAVQCLPRRFPCHCWPVRPHKYVHFNPTNGLLMTPPKTCQTDH